MEFCPNCGDFVDDLDESTGWCYDCAGVKLCKQCGQPSKKNICHRCSYLNHLNRNADEIERVMAALQVNATTAKRLVQVSNRPTCASCGEEIKYGRRDQHRFCSKTPTCRKAQNCFHYHRSKGKSRQEAFDFAMVIVYTERLLEKRAA